jgi:serine/threonine protein kinase
MDLVKIDFDPLEEWEKIKIVGRGGSSVVYQAKIKRTGEYIAAKEIPIDGLTKDQVLAIEGEVETMKNLNHSSIVNYLGTRRYSNHFYIFMEYADMGSLRQFYQKHGALSECHAAYCVKQILLGLNYLHSNGIAHRDVKGANVLMTRKGEMKLADFGASKRFDSASLISGLKGVSMTIK